MRGAVAVVAGALSIVSGILVWIMPHIRYFIPASLLFWFIGAISGNIVWSSKESSPDQRSLGKLGFILAMIGFGVTAIAFLRYYLF